ncbi:MAG: hypothetical protein NC131_18220 [Roseburia sp.]|nr:hypothetical protein [Roseburia sp.]
MTKITQQTEILNRIKTQSWNHKLTVDADPNKKWFSISQVINALTKPFDEVAVATRCAEKATPGSKYWGMSVDEIIASWKLKASVAADRGMGLDTYIQSVLHDKPKPLIDDPILQKKCAQFDLFKEKCLDAVPGIQFVGSEIWLNSEKFGIRGRLDALFVMGEHLIIFDWKNNDEFKVNTFEKMEGPCDFLPTSDINKFTIQLYGYKYFLQEEFGMSVKSVRVVQFTQDVYTIHKPTFEYRKDFMEEVFNYAIGKLL